MKITTTIILFALTFCSGFSIAENKIRNQPTVAEAFSSALIGTPQENLPSYFSQISESSYATFSPPFSIKVEIKNGLVSFVETEVKFPAGDYSQISNYEKLLGSLFYSKSSSLSGQITENKEQGEDIFTITTSEHYGEKCTYRGHEERNIEKRLSRGILKMSYFGGRDAPSCDNYRRARENGYDMVAFPGKLTIWMHE